MIEKILNLNTILAIIIYKEYKESGIHFFTPDTFSQQLGYMNRPKDYVIKPHKHNLIPRKVTLTQEVLLIKTGKVRIDFYDSDQNYLESRILNSGDVILLAEGGHGFKMLKDSEIIEIKQGPYSEEEDKVHFDSIEETKIIIK